ncbi:rubredoxin [Fulvivirga ligni]|uniref:rubredoxin n=1 Tax=Fulvivirga ligni TaxID=2904246 RepID=UPI001F1F7DFC|nr:rubredoxin [Fulvivirga ligni]UII22405.1 rubredoxin [Fulvivirga ligni]
MSETKFRDLVRVFVKGGIISPGDLLKILLVAHKVGSEYIHIGSRQDILFPVPDDSQADLDSLFQEIDLQYELEDFHYQNIASSYVALDIQPSKQWLVAHLYQYILNSFDYNPKLRINIVDPSQSMVPLFTGNINFIASDYENFWFVYLRFTDQNSGKPWQLPFLLYGEEISAFSKKIEELNDQNPQIEYAEIYNVLKTLAFKTQPLSEKLTLPEVNFSYYEGINRMPDGKYWLGLYWRNNKFSVNILEAICSRCLNTDIGVITLTPWKSLIIKGIMENHRVGWEKLMGKSGMNLRHSSLELNWHLPVRDREALDLKVELVRTLDQQDISTYGLSFTIKTSEDITPFSTVVIEKNNLHNTYNILYSKDFNPNLMDYQLYARNVEKESIAALLIELSHIYYDNLPEDNVFHNMGDTLVQNLKKDLYQCSRCKTLYDEEYGDPQNSIKAGVAFADLPVSYQCPLCGSEKALYERAIF